MKKQSTPMINGYGCYRLIYTVDKIQKELIVEVELKQVEGMLAPRQNVYYGELKVNGIVNNDYKDLSHCVNARLLAEDIGNEMKKDLIIKLRSEGKHIKIKSEIKQK